MTKAAMSDPEIHRISVDKLIDSGENPGKMSVKKYNGLVAFIKMVGFRQPLTVRKMKIPPDGMEEAYEIEDGHHRVRAAKEIGFTELPCVVFDDSDEDAKAIRIGMNNFRGELDLTIVGMAFEELIDDTGWSHEQVSAMTGYDSTEIDTLLDAIREDADSVLDNVGAPSVVDDLDDEKPPKPFILEIAFTDKAIFSAAKRLLKKASGDAKDLAIGLQRVLEIETEQEEETN